MVASSLPIKVAVIGGGPGGMFFCHALETYRRELVQKNEKEALEQLPQVMCFERASGPGGVWRSERSFGDHVTTNEAGEPLTNMCE